MAHEQELCGGDVPSQEGLQETQKTRMVQRERAEEDETHDKSMAPALAGDGGESGFGRRVNA